MKSHYLTLLLALAGCEEVGHVMPAAFQTAEGYCAMLSNDYGHAFTCLTSQPNLQVTAFPDGSRGYCMYAQEKLERVGYSVTTYAGDMYHVTSESRASSVADSLRSRSPGYLRCTRS